MLEAAYRVAEEAHEGQVRLLGRAEYIDHPLAVGADPRRTRPGHDDARGALLHDAVEDTDVTLSSSRRSSATTSPRSSTA